MSSADTQTSISQKLVTLQIIVAGIQHHRRYALMVSVFVCLFGWLIVSFMPNKYESSAKVLADTRSMLKPLLTGIAVQNDTDEGIRVIAQTLLSRTNLENIALKADLDIESVTPERYENMLRKLKDEIIISGSSKNNVYTISYSHQVPEVAERVVSLTLKQFLDTVTSQSRLDSNSATDFLESQISERKIVLELAEKQLADFKRDNQGMLPQQGGGYYQSIANLRVELETLDGQYAAKEAEIQSLRSSFIPQSDKGRSPRIQTPFDARLSALRTMLDAESMQYTKDHPSIIELKRQIDLLEELRSESEESMLRSASSGEITPSSTGNDGHILQQFALEISKLGAERSVIAAKMKSVERRLKEMSAQIKEVPAIEAKLTSLQRDYNVSKELYDELVRRMEQAKISQNANNDTSDVKFQTLEPPRVPITPSSPNRIRLYVIVFFLSLILGVLISFAQSKLRARVWGVQQLSDIVGQQAVLGQIIDMDHENQIKKKRLKWIIFASGYLALIAILIALVGHEFYFGEPLAYWLRKL